MTVTMAIIGWLLIVAGVWYCGVWMWTAGTSREPTGITVVASALILAGALLEVGARL